MRSLVSEATEVPSQNWCYQPEFLARALGVRRIRYDAESTEDWTERLLLTGCAVLTACASGEQTKTLRQVDATEIAAAAGCSRDEVAVCGLLFVGCLFFAPLAQSVPAVVVAIAMPLSFSIAEGIGLGFITYVLIKLISGKASDCSVAVYVIAGIFILKYLFL